MNSQLFAKVWNLLRAFLRRRESAAGPTAGGHRDTMSDPRFRQTEQPDLIVVSNDLTDSDNWAAARFLQQLRQDGWLKCKIIWVIEPRQVLLGATLSEAELDSCKKLIAKVFPDKVGEEGRIILQGGEVKEGEKERIIAYAKGLPEAERQVLQKALKPHHGPREDAVLHGRLLAYDFLHFLQSPPYGQTTADAQDELYFDEDTLTDLQMPVNLNVHHPEELFSRTEVELRQHSAIMARPLDQRVPRLKEWYGQCTTVLKQKCSRQDIPKVSIDVLNAAIQKAERPLYLGGSSMRLLKCLVEERWPGNIEKMTCCFQAGAFEPKKNMFGNQFNVIMNPQAVRAVAQEAGRFKAFSVVSTDATLSVKYSLSGIADRDWGLARRCIGYNCRRVDAHGLGATDAATRAYHLGELNSLSGRERSVVMADLTAFLCALAPLLDLPHGLPAAQCRLRAVLFVSDDLRLEGDVEGRSGILTYDFAWADGKRSVDMAEAERTRREKEGKIALDLVKVLFEQQRS